MSRTLSEFLKTAGVQVTPNAPAPEKTAASAQAAAATSAAATAAPAKTAAADPAKAAAKGKAGTTQPDAAPAGGHKGRAVSGESSHSPEAQDTGGAKHAAVQYDPAVIKTAEQKWLLANDIVCADPDKAKVLYDSMAKTAEAEKMAELEKMAEEQRNIGALQYHGMVKESTAMRYAEGQATVQEVVKVAAWIGVPAESIVKRANEIKSATPMFEGQTAAQPNRALTGNHPATPARPESSATTQAAGQSGNTVPYEPEAVAGTRKATSGSDEKLTKFTDTMTLPGNPGLNHGQAVDQGKGYSK